MSAVPQGLSPRLQAGRLVARALAGAWRRSPPPLALSQDDLCQIVPILLPVGAAPLTWWRIKDSGLGTAPAAAQLRRTFLFYTLEAARQEKGIEEVVAHLGRHGVEPLLAKGLSVSRLYPAPGLRPYGDVDLCVRPQQLAKAQAALCGSNLPGPAVDLHRRFFELNDRSLEGLYQRSRPLAIGGSFVRVLGPEDHLRLLCLHLVHHAAQRPIWLCDIGLFIETLPRDFDWDYFLSGDRRRTGWVTGALLLSHTLLEARLDGVPAAVAGRPLPEWLAPSVLERWGLGARDSRPLSTYARKPGVAWREVRGRWPGGLEATDALRLPLNSLPRAPFQLAWFLWLAASFAPRKAAGLALRLTEAPFQRPG